MLPVFLAQWMKEKRSPYIVPLFFGLSIIATLMFGGMTESKLIIDVFSSEELKYEEETEWIELLNQSEAFEFRLRNEEAARDDVRQGRKDLAVQLLHDNYQLIVAVENANVQVVERYLYQVYTEELQLRAAVEQKGNLTNFREEVRSYLENPPLTLETNSPDGGVLESHDMKLQLLYAFTLFLAIFTIGFKVNAITAEKVSGVWNRVILSPVRKTEMYLGHLLYSSVIGFLQIMIILLIFFGLGYSFGESFGMVLLIAALYTLVTVAMVMLFTGILKTPEHFYMVFPSVVPIMPLLAGAYMPPGVITNPVILAVAEIFPITHAMDILMMLSSNTDLSEVLLPVAKLLLIGVICMGVGINLVERRKA